jgi:8-oxo-dGTP pyrophosphatase MutT (NUDIX family)
VSKLKDRLEQILNEPHHASAFARTGFWGAYGGAGAIFLARTSGRVLLARRSRYVLQPGTWGTIGGAVDYGENPEDTVVREAREELGVRVDAADLRLCYTFRAANSVFVYYNYTVLVGEEFSPRPNWEVADHAWVEHGRWPDPLHFGMEAWLRDPQGGQALHTLVQKIMRATAERRGGSR